VHGLLIEKGMSTNFYVMQDRCSKCSLP